MQTQRICTTFHPSSSIHKSSLAGIYGPIKLRDAIKEPYDAILRNLREPCTLLCIGTLKKYEQSALVKCVTTVLDPDIVEDTMENTYSGVVLSGKVESESRDKDIDE